MKLMSIINVNLSEAVGKIKPMHGMTNSPIVYGSHDYRRQWKRAGIPFARLHDTDYPKGPVVDIPRIFPDFKADENDPANYRFKNTDAVIEGIIDCGAEVIYRLGTSIEHTRQKIDTIVPTDMDKWARICCNIIRHYNEGWADGYHFNIRFWEIWNEPNLTQDDMWQGTQADYFRMYETASKLIKKEFPNVLVGGPTLAEAMEFEKNSLKAEYVDEAYARAFLEFVKRSESPLDFFSWHLYRRNIWEYDEVCHFMKNLVVEYGFGDIIMICDEWNIKDENNDFALDNGTYVGNSEATQWLDDMKSEIGASFVAAVMITFQKGPLDISTYYDSNPFLTFCGVFEKSGFPTKTYNSFRCFDKLYRLNGNEVKTDCDTENTYVLAAKNEMEAVLFISNYNGKNGDVKVSFDGLPEGKKRYSVVRTDKYYSHTLDEEGVLEGNVWEGSMLKNSTLLVTVTWEI